MNELLDLKVEICHLDLKENTIANLLTSANKVQEEIERLNNIINKTINILELSAQNKGICTCYETDTIQSALKELKGEN
ncbi:MAG: hypothetical protein VZR33_07960 [Methanosphaera sp.]|nr:hypothetical protein [Methanosphaera sp.]